MKENLNENKMKKNRNNFLPEKPCFFIVMIAGILAGVFLIITLTKNTKRSILCSSYDAQPAIDLHETTPTQLNAILHYATSKTVPQQSVAEIRISFDVLARHAPCNFLVFGLGHDSLMWSSFNPKGVTLFLEEDPTWVRSILQNAPDLHAQTVLYKTRLSEADELLASYKKNPFCKPNTHLRGNNECRLALADLPDEVYHREWDLIMIDAPKGYFPEAPGRMGAIFSAAVMARARRREGVTHVFLHDVNRKVEKIFAEEFLCKKFLVNGVGRLWHFEIPPAANASADSFC